MILILNFGEQSNNMIFNKRGQLSWAMFSIPFDVCHLSAVVAASEPQVGLPTNNNLDCSVVSWSAHR